MYSDTYQLATKDLFQGITYLRITEFVIILTGQYKLLKQELEEEKKEFESKFGKLKMRSSLLSPRKGQMFDSADYFSAAKKAQEKK